jgi:hypothetical protein
MVASALYAHAKFLPYAGHDMNAAGKCHRNLLFLNDIAVA